MDIKLLIGPVISVIAIGVSITLWWKGRNRKGLSYDIVSSTSLVKQHDEIGKKIKIMFEDQEIKDNVFLVLLKIVNTGNIPIESKDFTKDISIETTSGTILITEVKETNPSNLDVKLDNVGDGIATISPLLLNSKDEVIIKFLIKSTEDKPFKKENLKVKARIVGISEVTKVKNKNSLDSYFPFVAMILGIIVAISTAYVNLETIPWVKEIGGPIVGVSILAGVVISVVKSYTMGAKLAERRK